MPRTLITRDLAEPATPGAFDASVDLYTAGNIVPGLGTVTGTLRKRRLGPSLDPDSDGWSYSIVNEGYHTYPNDTWTPAFQLSAWYWIDTLPVSGHQDQILALMGPRFRGGIGAWTFGGLPPVFARLTTFFGHVPTSVVVPIREWFQLSLIHVATDAPRSRFVFRREGESTWTTILDFDFGLASAAFAGLDAFGLSGTARYGGTTLYSIDTKDDGMVVDDTCLPPAVKRRHWAIDWDAGNDNNEGSQTRPWKTVDRYNDEVANMAILPTVPDSTAVDAALDTIGAAATTDDHGANDASLETSLDAFYADCDVLHIGDADFQDEALYVRTAGLVISGDGGTPQLRHVIDPSEWTTNSRPGVYQCPGATHAVLWEDDKWLGHRVFATSETATLDALASDPSGTFYCDNTTMFLRSDTDPATNGSVYTRSRYRTTSGVGTSAILVSAKDVQVRDIILRGTTLAHKSTNDGIQAYCLQWTTGATGICEARDITADKGSKHTLGSTIEIDNTSILRRRVTYGSGDPYPDLLQWTVDVDFGSGSLGNCRSYMYGCNVETGVVGTIGETDGDPDVAGPFYTSHGVGWDWLKIINCNLKRGTFFGQGIFPGGVTMVEVQCGGDSVSGGWAEPLTVDRCRSDGSPFGTWSGSHQCKIINSIMVVNNNVSNQGFTRMSGPATIQGCTIDTRGNTSSDDVSLKSVWDAENKSGSFDFHGNLILNEKGFGILSNGQALTISSDYNVFLYETEVRLSTNWGDTFGDFDTWAEWQARGHDLNSVLLNSDFGLALGADYLPEYYSPLGEFVPAASVPALVGTNDYSGSSRPTDTNYTAGALEVDMTLVDMLEGIKAKTDLLPDIQSGTEGGVALTTANGVLTAGQQGQLDILGTGQSVAISPVGRGGKITLYSGYAYPALDVPDSSPSTLPDVGTTVYIDATTDKALNQTSFTLTGVVALDGADKVARFNVSSEDVGDAANYRYIVYSDSGSGKIPYLVGNLVVLDL